MELELQIFLLILHKWTLINSLSPQLLFLFKILEFCLGHANLRKWWKTHGEQLWGFLFFLSVSSPPQCCSSCSPFGCIKLQPLRLQLVRWAPATQVLFCASQCGNCLQRVSEVNVELACVLISRIVIPQVLLSWLVAFQCLQTVALCILSSINNDHLQEA